MLGTLVNPGERIPPFITVLTGITEAMLAPAPPIEAVLPSLLEFLRGAVLVAHNAPYDVGFLKAACARHGYTWPNPRVLDTAALARRVLTRDEVPNRKLGTSPSSSGRFPAHPRALGRLPRTVDVERADRALGTTRCTLGTPSSSQGRPPPPAASATRRGLPHCPGSMSSGADYRPLYVRPSSNRHPGAQLLHRRRDRARCPRCRRGGPVEALDCAHSLEAEVRELRSSRPRPPYNPGLISGTGVGEAAARRPALRWSGRSPTTTRPISPVLLAPHGRAAAACLRTPCRCALHRHLSVQIRTPAFACPSWADARALEHEITARIRPQSRPSVPDSDLRRSPAPVDALLAWIEFSPRGSATRAAVLRSRLVSCCAATVPMHASRPHRHLRVLGRPRTTLRLEHRGPHAGRPRRHLATPLHPRSPRSGRATADTVLAAGPVPAASAEERGFGLAGRPHRGGNFGDWVSRRVRFALHYGFHQGLVRGSRETPSSLIVTDVRIRYSLAESTRHTNL